ncbi:MAG: hypothetical protein RIE86_12765 [Imperialibacter sp.]|jgi:hypothetical protein
MDKKKKEEPLKIHGTLDEVLKASFKGKPEPKPKKGSKDKK